LTHGQYPHRHADTHTVMPTKVGIHDLSSCYKQVPDGDMREFAARYQNRAPSKPRSAQVPTQQLSEATESQRQPGALGFTPHPPVVEL